MVIRHLNGILFSKCFFMQSSVSASDNEGMEWDKINVRWWTDIMLVFAYILDSMGEGGRTQVWPMIILGAQV